MIDLHTHSLFSDGSELPAQLVARAEAVGLSAIALTDHNTVAGLDEFMETYYTEYDAQMTCLAFSLAKEFGLLPGGGSDYHGAAKPDISLGTGWGELQIPDRVLGILKNERNK